jgi:O-antigen ligase
LIYGVAAAAALTLGALLTFRQVYALAFAGLIVAVMAGMLVQRELGIAPEQFVLIVALGVTAILGRSFSYLQVGPLYVTDFALVLAAAILAIRAGLGRADPAVRLPRTLVLLIGGYFVVGGFAALHGLVGGADPFYVLRDSALVVYAGIAAILVLAFPRIADARLLFNVLAWIGVASSIYALAALGTSGDNTGGVPVAQGVYFSFFFLAVFARASQGLRVPAWQWALVVPQLAFLLVLTVRTSWIAALVAGAVLFATSAAERRERIVGVVVAIATIGLIAGLVLPDALKSQKVTQVFAQGAEGIINPGLQSYKAANASWRLEFWNYELRAVGREPLTGVGFGPGASFCFVGTCSDTRLTRDATQISGSHNSYVHVAYRTGLPGIGLLIGIIAFAVGLAVKALRRARLLAADEDALLLRISLATFSFVAVSAFFSEVLENPYIGAFFWLTLAMMIVCARSVLGRTAMTGVAPGESA